MKKQLLRTIAAALALLTAFALCACGEKETNDDQPDFVPVSMISAPVEKQEIDQTGTLIMEHRVDSVEFTGGGPGASAKLTATYADIFGRRAETVISDTISTTLEVIYESDIDYPGHSYYSLTPEVIRSDETLFVLRVNTDTYMAGAPHGNYLSEALCFDPATGDQVALRDIGVNGADPTAQIITLLAEKYRDVIGEDGFYTDNLAEAEDCIGMMLSDDMFQWYLDDRFVLISNPYDLAHYAMGLFEIALSAEELAGIVDEKWFAEPAPAPNTRIFTDGSDFDDFDMVHTVGDYGYEMNFVWFDTDVQNVYLVEAVFSEDGESFIGGTTIAAYPELKKGEAILLDIMVPEGIPNTAISADIDGSTYTWLIGYNGRDGGISFMETDLQPAG